MSAVRVRPARLADVGRIGEIHVAAWHESYAGLLPAAQIAAFDVAQRTAMWHAQLAGGTARGVIVAENDGGLIGFGACARQRTAELVGAGYSGEVTALYVLRAGQRHGAGRLLMQAMARRLIAEGERAMALWVLTDNAPARRFYERLGGTRVAERSAHEEGAETAYGWRDLAALTTA